MKNLFKSTKSKIIAAVSGVAVTAAVVTGILLFTGEESYRTIAVEEVTGTTLVSSETKDTVEAYEGLHLYSGDDVTVQTASDMTMVLDMDKYVYAKEQGEFGVAFAIAAILMILTVLINFAATLVGKYFATIQSKAN